MGVIGELAPDRKYELAYRADTISESSAPVDAIIGVAFPGMDTWKWCRHHAQQPWIDIFEGQLTPEDYHRRYDKYDPHAAFLYVRPPVEPSTDLATAPLGATEFLFANPDAKTIDQTDTKTIHDIFVPGGDFDWGELAVDEDGMAILESYWPPTCPDVLLHYIDRERIKQRRIAINTGLEQGSAKLDVNKVLESLQAGLVLGQTAILASGADIPDSQTPRHVIITNLVKEYEELSHARYPGGVVNLGPRTPYGADPGDETQAGWARPVVMDVDSIITSGRLSPELFDQVCSPDSFAAELAQIRRGYGHGQ